MLYKNQITLTPELAKDRSDLDLRQSRQIVEECIRRYNEAGQRARVPKFIEPDSLKLERDHMAFVLCSEAYLTSPTRTCRHLIQMLAASDFYRVLIHNGRIFRGESEYLGAEDRQDPPVQPESVPDEQVLMDVIRLFFANTPENRAKIDQIKTILY